VANLGLFEKSLSKISAATVDKFGSVSAVSGFLEAVAGCGSVSRAVEIVNNSNISKVDSMISPLHVQRLINDDRYLTKCVAMAKQITVERAESVLYERVINGYEEITYGRDGSPIQIKRKYCAKSLMEYLKANSGKYCGSSKGGASSEQDDELASDIDIGKIEIESYAIIKPQLNQ